MQSAAQKQVEVIADVERISRALYAHLQPSLGTQESCRRIVTDLLRRDVIRVGHRPNVERPIVGQGTFSEVMEDYPK